MTKRATKRRKTKRAAAVRVREKAENSPTYCTVCGATLDGFALSDDVQRLDMIRKNFEKCRKSGKFNGQFCSKLFIASPVDLDTLLEDIADSD